MWEKEIDKKDLNNILVRASSLSFDKNNIETTLKTENTVFYYISFAC